MYVHTVHSHRTRNTTKQRKARSKRQVASCRVWRFMDRASPSRHLLPALGPSSSDAALARFVHLRSHLSKGACLEAAYFFVAIIKCYIVHAIILLDRAGLCWPLLGSPA